MLRYLQRSCCSVGDRRHLPQQEQKSYATSPVQFSLAAFSQPEMSCIGRSQIPRWHLLQKASHSSCSLVAKSAHEHCLVTYAASRLTPGIACFCHSSDRPKPKPYEGRGWIITPGVDTYLQNAKATVGSTYIIVCKRLPHRDKCVQKHVSHTFVIPPTNLTPNRNRKRIPTGRIPSGLALARKAHNPYFELTTIALDIKSHGILPVGTSLK